MFQPVQGILGIVFMLFLAWLCSEKRRLVSWRFVALGMFVQVVLATVLLKLPPAVGLFQYTNRGVAAMEKATQAGASFVFGFLGGAPPPYAPSGAGSDIVLAFRFLPLIIVISALAALLTYWRILPAIVRALAWLVERAMGIGGAVALAAVANPFLGMVESSILIRPYVALLTRSELCMLMCTGLATIAGIWTGAAAEHARSAGVTPNEEGLTYLKNKLATLTGLPHDAAVADVVVAVHQALGRAPSRVLLATLDDALGVREQPNMPGTTSSWPNWSLALPKTLEELQEDPLPRQIAAALRR